MTLVLDASSTLDWILEERPDPVVVAAVNDVGATGAVVPSLWRLEVVNVLQAYVRRGTITIAQRDESLADLLSWNVEIDDETDQRAWHSTLRLADRHRLTAYDAAYLEVADRRGLPLATLDKALIRAAGELGVRLVS